MTARLVVDALVESNTGALTTLLEEFTVNVPESTLMLPAKVLVPVVLVACIVPNTPRVEATLATLLVVVAPERVQ